MAKKSPAKPSHRARVHYAGRVQGVGFRYTAERLAHEAGVFGFVKNLRDGRVELVCEGPKEKIEAFLASVRASMLGPYIQKADCVWEEPTCRFTDFTVEFDH